MLPEEHIALFEALGLPVPPEEDLAQTGPFESAQQSRTRGREARFRLIVAAASPLWPLRLFDLSTPRTSGRLFDNGLWTLDDDYRILVATGAFEESSPDQKPLGEHHGVQIRLPKDAALWPSREHLQWHRRKKFLSS